MNCISDDIKFADDEFPHSLEQLISKGDQRRQRPILEKASWLQPNEFFSCSFSNLELFNYMQPSDIIPGQIIIKNTLALIVGLAEKKRKFVKNNIFYNIDKNPQGVYSVQLYIDGKPREVLIDTWLPGRLDIRMPLFLTTRSREIWPALLEKAYVKTVVSYFNLEYIALSHILSEFLPGPIFKKSFVNNLSSSSQDE